MTGGRRKVWTGTANCKGEDIFWSTHKRELPHLGEQASSAAHIQYPQSSQRFARQALRVHVEQIIPGMGVNHSIQKQP